MSTFNINRPMTIKELKTLSPDSQRLYLGHLYNGKNFRPCDIAEMLGVSAQTLSRYTVALGFATPENRGGSRQQHEARREAYLKWVAGDADTTPTPHQTPPDAPQTTIAPPAVLPLDTPIVSPAPSCGLLRGSVTFEGPLTDLLRLNLIPPKGCVYTVSYEMRAAEPTHGLPPQEQGVTSNV